MVSVKQKRKKNQNSENTIKELQSYEKGWSWMTLKTDTDSSECHCFLFACIRHYATPAAEFWRSIQYDMRGFTYKANADE